MKKFFWLVVMFILVLPLMGAGCVSVKSSDEIVTTDRGVFVSHDKGTSWEQKTSVSNVDQVPQSISAFNALEMFFDPQDSQTIYLTTESNGVYVSYNGGEKWESFYSQSGLAYEIAVDPTSRNVIYISGGNKIVKSIDGGTTWNEVYFEAIPEAFVETISIDSINSKIVYLGVSDGRLIRSLDAGKTWNRVSDFEGKIKQVLVNPNDSDIIYVATQRDGVFRSGNYGKTWHNVSLGDNIEETKRLTKEYKGIGEFKIMLFDQTQKDAILIGTDYGLLKNKNGENDWEIIRLLTLPTEIDVVSLAMNAKNNQEIYYGINNALYFSKDGGKNWAARSLPTHGMAQYLLVSPVDPDIVYLGVYVPLPPEDNNGLLF
ncbi:MAG: hypothetical protein WCX88_01240 [Patescibacteria group bacterium]